MININNDIENNNYYICTVSENETVNENQTMGDNQNVVHDVVDVVNDHKCIDCCITIISTPIIIIYFTIIPILHTFIISLFLLFKAIIFNVSKIIRYSLHGNPEDLNFVIYYSSDIFLDI